MKRRQGVSLCLLVLLGSYPTHLFAQDRTIPGPLSVPHPTLEHLSLEWSIEGDDDADSEVQVRFRRVGEEQYRQGQPLVRVLAGSNAGFSWGNKHSGSLFGLSPGTSYEIELTLKDPDGGEAVQTVMATTRPVPEIAAEAPRVEVTPATIQAALDALKPGQVLVLMPGTYGSIVVAADGTRQAPIVLQGSSADEVIIEGEVRLDGRASVWIEGVTIKGLVKLNGAKDVVVRGCKIEAVGPTGDGIAAYGQGSTDGYFADNIILGRTQWSEQSLGVSGDNQGEGIVMAGAGNVIARNRVVGFRDCISLLEDAEARDQRSVDILDNDLDTCADDAIEADFAMGNVRVMRNRITNAFIGLSSQPGLGGPTWFVRNVLYNVIFQAFKPNRGSVGDIWLHNTVVKSGDAMGVYAGRTWSRARFRNNLFIGGEGGREHNGYSSGSGQVFSVADADTDTCDFDYDGFGSVGTGEFRGRVGMTRFASLQELRTLTTEAHAVEVDLSIFEQPVALPTQVYPAYMPPDLRLKQSAAVDVGQALANINDGFSGAAPDLGAYELGSPTPQYGPHDPKTPPVDPPKDAVCGDRIVEGQEQCDDGNVVGSDGCDARCQVEEPGQPVATCGDQKREGSEACDDGNTEDGDGCSARCTIEDNPQNPQPQAPGQEQPTSTDEGCACGVSPRRAAWPGSAAWFIALVLSGVRLRRRHRC